MSELGFLIDRNGPDGAQLRAVFYCYEVLYGVDHSVGFGRDESPSMKLENFLTRITVTRDNQSNVADYDTRT